MKKLFKKPVIFLLTFIMILSTVVCITPENALASETSVVDTVTATPLSVSKTPKYDGKGYEFYENQGITK